MSVADEAIKKAVDLGATVAGFVPAKKLKNCPSALSAGPQGFQNFTGSIMVLGLYHDPDCPEMDLWEEGRSTKGDRMLHRMTKELCRWLKDVHGIDAHDIPYQVHNAGIYLKDAAILAGLGCIGKNNLVIVRGYGPKIRFRALWADLKTPEPSIQQQPNFCDVCSAPCHVNCPMNAFFDGKYHREKCLKRIDVNKKTAYKNSLETGSKKQIDHCRICELVCPGGQKE
ncbi:hypothetical protein F1737_04510 [Methanoplanus sp. FWC-SCC4]|uniref:4Fe-4S ferredoxin-type domain-containing protein n=1 Tax=Methanochimaera problematica TaxID=2609417 RepID=A0AA97I3L3_9EURY|nr:hypothetical protein [Methanoplanus sp. FWC-SCC4]WOF16016.1 hypothetical protein F1737_04510 [Methanoplanus sp. FWC-SCC4]